MNTKIYNGVYNIIITNKTIDVAEVVNKYQLSKSYNIYKGDLNKIAFQIREHELKHDEIFRTRVQCAPLNGSSHTYMTMQELSEIKINDPGNYQSVTHNHECLVNNNFLYCSSMVLWIMSQYSRNKYPLFHNLRRSRILLKRIGDYIK